MITSSTILHGLLDFALSFPKETPRRGSLDAVEQSFQTGRKEAFQVDDARSGRLSHFPGYSSMYIDEIVRVEEIPGLAYEQTLKGLGLLNGRDKIMSDPIATPEEGWDTGEHDICTLHPELYQLKRPHPLIPSLYVTDRSVETEIGRVKRVSLSYKGIVPVETDNLGNRVPKGYKRKISSSTSSQQTSSPITIYYRVAVPGGYTWVPSAISKDYNFDDSRLQVTDSFLDFEPPDYNRLPGNWIPPGAPAELEPTAGLTQVIPSGAFGAIGSAGAQVTYNEPYGWVLKSYNCDQLFDLPVYLYTLTAEWVPRYQIKY